MKSIVVKVVNNSFGKVTARVVDGPKTLATVRSSDGIGVIDNLRELKDVDFSNVPDGAVLVWNEETGKFEFERVSGLGDIDGGTF